MKLSEIKSINFTYHNTLNPLLWKEQNGIYVLDNKVKEKLLEIANKFISTLGLKTSTIKDYVITGSNCNYNYTNKSDLDIHILFSEVCEDCEIDIEDCLQAKKTLWNDRHDLTIHKIPVEVYATTMSEKLVKDAGTYSLMLDKWINMPEKKKISFDSVSVIIKADEISKEIDQIISSKSDDEKAIQDLLDRISRMRSAGIQSGGEFSIENLVFKTLRNEGFIDKIRNYSVKAQDDELSLK